MGVVTEIRGVKARAKISSTLATDFLPVMQVANSFKRSWTPIRVGEQCIVLPIRGDINAGVILRGFYCDDFTAPSEEDSTAKTTFEDGTTISYDTDKKFLHVRLVKDTKIEIGANADITIKGDANITVNGKTNVTCATSTFSGVVVCGSLIVGGAGGSEVTSAGGTLTIDDSVVFKGDARAEGDFKANGEISDSRGSLTNHTNNGYSRD
ncbi:MAG: phage baseplate assembly protein V [Campylobacteraceae bacterium]